MENNSISKYSYYDTPDGQDCFKKLFFAAKYGTVGALVTATADVLYNSHPKGYTQTAIRYGFFLFPMVGIACTFTAITCAATSLRKKDDEVNYLIGGMCAGGCSGVWMRSRTFGSIAAVALGSYAFLKKNAVMNGYDLFPDNPYPSNDIWLNTHDFTISKDPRLWNSNGLNSKSI